ncbi:MAG TPA: hypothetical protein VFL97_07140 [Nitrococcus sp.]|nr:hypothetical protein [Nitrococcus sp.]
METVTDGNLETSFHAVTPAKAGVYLVLWEGKMDVHLRRNDEIREFFEVP